MSENLFIIDDDEEILNLLTLALSRSGFNIETANNYGEAIAKIDRGYIPDLVLMDYYLPGLDGISLAGEFLKKGVKSPVFLFTAADSDVINLSDCPENVIDIIRKPFSFEEIVQKLNQSKRYNKLFLDKEEVTDKKNQVVDLNNDLYTQKISDIQKFLDIVSHKIKNSLQTITNYVELLKKGYIDEEDKDRVFQTILDKVSQIKHELDILKRPAEFYYEEDFSLKNVIRTVLSDLKKDIKARDLYIKTDFQKNLPLYYGRRGIFAEFFLEFFGKIVNCSEMSSKIHISLSQDNDEYLINVIQSEVSQTCRDLYNYFELSLKDDKEIRFAKAFVDFKDLGCRIIIDKDNEGRGIYKIIIPKSSNVSDRD
ncbi:MAG: response regulator [Proteobacteria bacterium]|nr:response regulator [Pseudomonadota bacterium]